MRLPPRAASEGPPKRLSQEAAEAALRRPRMPTGGALIHQNRECRCGNTLSEGIVAGGIFFWVEPRVHCGPCGSALERGDVRWSCSHCDLDYCSRCAEASTGGVQSLEDFCEEAELVMAQASSAPDEEGWSLPASVHRRSSRESRVSRRASRRESAESLRSSLSLVPFLGSRPLAQVQGDALARLQRLLCHGDLRGSRRLLARARQLNVDEEDLVAPAAALRQLEAEGMYSLLLRPG